MIPLVEVETAHHKERKHQCKSNPRAPGLDLTSKSEQRGKKWAEHQGRTPMSRNPIISIFDDAGRGDDDHSNCNTKPVQLCVARECESRPANVSPHAGRAFLLFSTVHSAPLTASRRIVANICFSLEKLNIWLVVTAAVRSAASRAAVGRGLN